MAVYELDIDLGLGSTGATGAGCVKLAPPLCRFTIIVASWLTSRARVEWLPLATKGAPGKGAESSTGGGNEGTVVMYRCRAMICHLE